MAEDGEPLVLGVLVSGSGTNMEAIARAIEDGDLPARIALVVSDNPDAFALERAKKRSIPTRVIELGEFPDRPSFDRAVIEALESEGVELVVLAGFMKLIGPEMVDAFANRIMNIHPALLPSFPGERGVADALEHGVKFVRIIPILRLCILKTDKRQKLLQHVFRHASPPLPELLYLPCSHSLSDFTIYNIFYLNRCEKSTVNIHARAMQAASLPVRPRSRRWENSSVSAAAVQTAPTVMFSAGRPPRRSSLRFASHKSSCHCPGAAGRTNSPQSANWAANGPTTLASTT